MKWDFDTSNNFMNRIKVGNGLILVFRLPRKAIWKFSTVLNTFPCLCLKSVQGGGMILTYERHIFIEDHGKTISKHHKSIQYNPRSNSLRAAVSYSTWWSPALSTAGTQELLVGWHRPQFWMTLPEVQNYLVKRTTIPGRTSVITNFCLMPLVRNVGS